MTSKEGMLTLRGREFKLIRLSIEAIMNIAKQDYEKKFAAFEFKKVMEGGKEYKEFEKLWKSFCNSIFKKSFLWALLSPIGWMPKQLRFGELTITDMGDIRQSFFAWQEAPLNQQGEPEKTSEDSK